MRRFSGDKPEKKRTSGKSTVGKPEKEQRGDSGSRFRKESESKPWKRNNERGEETWRSNKKGDEKPWSNKRDYSDRSGEEKRESGSNSRPWKDRGEASDKPWKGRREESDRPWKAKNPDDKKSWNKDQVAENSTGKRFHKEERPYRRKSEGEEKPFRRKSEGEERSYRRKDEGEDRSFRRKSEGEGRSYRKKGEGEGRPWENRKEGEDRPYKRRSEGEDRPYRRRSEGENSPFRSKPEREEKPWRNKREEERPYRAKTEKEEKPWRSEKEGEERRYRSRSGGEERPFRGRKDEDSKPWRDKSTGEEKPWRSRNTGDERPKKPGSWNTAKSGKSSYSSKKSNESEDGLIRLNKYIANAGVSSRREADEMIAAGVIKVNGVIVTELGTKVGPEDKVQIGDETLNPQKKVYLLLNKPKGYITTVDDPQERNTVMMLVKDACRERIYPVGRLDRNTSGLLLMTNDGEMAKKLTHPSHRVRKIYHVELNKALSKSDMVKLTEGIELEDGMMNVDEIAYTGSGDDKKNLGVVIHSGKNRVIRRLFEALEYEVTKLDRVAFANLTKKDLPRGRWRFLDESEINVLKMI